MDWLDVLRRIEAGEDERTEFKRGLGDGSGVCRALCAFGNGDGGLIVLGVEDPGVIVGVRENAERVQERLTDFLQTSCSVPISARCGRHEDPNGWVHWIEVPRQPRGFEPLHYGGRFWIRRQRSSVEPSPNERQELFNNFGFVLTEEQVIRSAGLDDMDINAFRTFVRAQGLDADEEPQPRFEDDMRNAGVLAFVGWAAPTDALRSDGLRKRSAKPPADFELLCSMCCVCRSGQRSGRGQCRGIQGTTGGSGSSILGLVCEPRAGRDLPGNPSRGQSGGIGARAPRGSWSMR